MSRRAGWLALRWIAAMVFLFASGCTAAHRRNSAWHAAEPGAVPRRTVESPAPSDAGEVPPAAGAPALRGATATVEPLAAARARGDATLEDCFRAAVQRNERIGRAEEDYRQAVLLKTTALGTVLPRVTLENNYNLQNKVTLPNPAGVAFSFEEKKNQLLLHLQQPIFAGFRDANFFGFARNSIDAFRNGLEDSRRLLYASVAQVFYSALQIEGAVKTLQDSVEVERERFREIQARHEAGLARKTEVLLVESQLASDESRLTRAGNDFKVARDQLSFLMATPLDLPLRDDVTVPESPSGAPPEAPTTAGLDDLIREARENRSDLRQREKAVEAARYQVSLARGEYYPTVDLDAEAILERQHYSDFSQETDWTAQINFSFPLFDGGRIRANVATARSKLQQATLDRDELARQIGVEIQNAWLTLESDRAQVETLEKSVASADENDRLVREEYRSGLATNLEVITGHNQLLSARLELERQKYQVKLDWIALKLAQGLLPESEKTP